MKAANTCFSISKLYIIVAMLHNDFVLSRFIKPLLLKNLRRTNGIFLDHEHESEFSRLNQVHGESSPANEVVAESSPAIYVAAESSRSNQVVG